MDKKEDLITPNQSFSLILMTLIGVRLLSLASEVTEIAKQDAWLSTLFAGALATGAAYLYARYSLRFPKMIFTETLSVVYGKTLGHIINLILFSWAIVMSGLSLREFSATLRITILDRTPPWAIWVGVLAVTSYVVIAGIEVMARFYDFLLIITLGIIVIMASASWQVMDLRNLMPVMESSPSILKGILPALHAFSQFAVIGLPLPFMRTNKGFTARVLVAMAIITFIYTLSVFECIAAFGAAETTYLVVPILTLVKSIDLPFILFERLELFLMLVWIPIAVTTIATHQLIAVMVFNRDWHLSFKSWGYLTWGVAIGIFVVAAIPPDITVTSRLSDMLDTFTLVLGFVLVPLSYLVAIIRGKRGDGREADRRSTANG